MEFHMIDGHDFCFTDNRVRNVSSAEPDIKLPSDTLSVYCEIPDKLDEAFAVLPLDDDGIIGVEILLCLSIYCPTRA